MGAGLSRYPGDRRERAAPIDDRADQRPPAGGGGVAGTRDQGRARPHFNDPAAAYRRSVGNPVMARRLRAVLPNPAPCARRPSMDARDRPAETGFTSALSNAHGSRVARAAFHARVRDRLPALLPRLRPL